jgi:hypothetical protein
MGNGQLMGKGIFKDILVNHKDNWRSKLGNMGWVRLMEVLTSFNRTQCGDEKNPWDIKVTHYRCSKQVQ